ncbi:MAG: HNH endonuclease [Bacteroidales bacterium]|nr:HNH endonuclease [Bacteroidales bacterium]
MTKYRATHNGLKRLKTLSIKEVFDWLENLPVQKLYWQENGKNIRLSLKNAKIFYEKGISCINCGIKGSYFAVEKDKGAGLHLDLYAKKETGDVMMTVDHIIPSSKGGSNKNDNLQTMCKICNEKKADAYDEETKIML